MTNENSTPPLALNLKHHFLVAMPTLNDDFFSNSITYVCEHSATGAMGMVINQPMAEVTLGSVLNQLQFETEPGVHNMPVLRGGPVSLERGFVLHEGEGHWESTIHLCDDVYLTASRDILKAIAEGCGPNRTLFTLGYAGWSAGQLEQEISSNSWLTLPASKDILFDAPIEERWTTAARSIGIDINLLTSTPGHA